MDARSYTVGAKLSDGPFGALHEGVHPQTQARVLLRVLPASLNKDGKALSRLKGLKKAVQRFLTGQSQGDPSAAPDPVLPMLLEYGNLPGGLVFLASELVQGEPLIAQRRRSMGLPLPNKALRIGRQLATCLTLAHGASLFHLRLSPAKILLGSADGEQVKLLDLGLHQALHDLLPGSAGSDVTSQEERVYLAPEQRKGELGGAPADVFALGVILYELASGKLPSQAALDDAGQSQVTSLPQLLPSWQRPLAVLLERMLATEPLARPAMGEVAALLQHLSAQQPASGTSLPPSGTSLPPSGTSLPPSATSLPPSSPATPPAVSAPVVADALSDGQTIAAVAKSAPAPAAPKAVAAAPVTDSLSDGPTTPHNRHRNDSIGFAQTMASPVVRANAAGDSADKQSAIEISAEYTQSGSLQEGSGAQAGGGTAATSAEPGVPGQVALKPGQLVGNYRVNSKIGQGGMGSVYAAVHKQIGRRAAIKILHGPLAATSDYAARFLNEARAVNMLRHPGLVEVFDFGQLPDGTLYIIMEFLEGESLRGLLRRQGTLPEEDAKELALQMGQALLAAHMKGIVHREAYEKTMTCFRVSAKDAHRRRIGHGYSEAEDCSYSPLQLV